MSSVEINSTVCRQGVSASRMINKSRLWRFLVKSFVGIGNERSKWRLTRKWNLAIAKHIERSLWTQQRGDKEVSKVASTKIKRWIPCLARILRHGARTDKFLSARRFIDALWWSEMAEQLRDFRHETSIFENETLLSLIGNCKGLALISALQAGGG